MQALHDVEMEAVADPLFRRKLLSDAHRSWGIEGKAPEAPVDLGAGAIFPTGDEFGEHMGADAIEGFSSGQQIVHPLMDAIDELLSAVRSQQIHPVDILPRDQGIPRFRAGYR